MEIKLSLTRNGFRSLERRAETKIVSSTSLASKCLCRYYAVTYITTRRLNYTRKFWRITPNRFFILNRTVVVVVQRNFSHASRMQILTLLFTRIPTTDHLNTIAPSITTLIAALAVCYRVAAADILIPEKTVIVILKKAGQGSGFSRWFWGVGGPSERTTVGDFFQPFFCQRLVLNVYYAWTKSCNSNRRGKKPGEM